MALSATVSSGTLHGLAGCRQRGGAPLVSPCPRAAARLPLVVTLHGVRPAHSSDRTRSRSVIAGCSPDLRQRRRPLGKRPDGAGERPSVRCLRSPDREHSSSAPRTGGTSRADNGPGPAAGRGGGAPGRAASPPAGPRRSRAARGWVACAAARRRRGRNGRLPGAPAASMACFEHTFDVRQLPPHAARAPHVGRPYRVRPVRRLRRR